MNSKNRWRALIIAVIAVGVVLAIQFGIFPFHGKEEQIASTSVTPSAADNVPPQSSPRKASASITASEQGETIAEFNPYEDEQIKAQIMQVADLYEQASKYPHYSQPIQDPANTGELEPFEATEVDTPFPLEDLDEPVRLQIATDRFQYFPGDVIQVRMILVGVSEDSFITATATVAGARGDLPLAAELNRVPGTAMEFRANLDTKLVPASSFSQEMLLKVNVTVDQSPMFSTLGFRFNEAPATVVGIPYARINGDSLDIPLQYTVYLDGYYFASAILAEQSSGRALIRLQAEGRMPVGNGVLTMRAHNAALRAAGSEGPYVVRSINSYRGAEDGEAFDMPASSAQAQYAVQGFPFSDYPDTAYHDPDNEERIEFLKKLGGVQQESPVADE